WRWAGVPFFLRAGKRMPKRSTTIRVQFKRPPHLTFGRGAMREVEPNAITLHIQPEEGISLRFAAKVPAAGIRMRSVNMDFLYASSFLAEVPDAYERLIAAAREQIKESEHIHPRTSVLDVIVVASEDAEAERAARVIEDLAAHHPCRAIVVMDEPAGGESRIDATVTSITHTLVTGA